MKIDAPPEIEDKVLQNWLYQLWEKSNEDHLFASTTWDPGNIVANADEHKEVTVPGAQLGDQVLVSFSLPLSHLVLSAEVSAADTVEAQLYNHTGGAVNLDSGTLYVRVLRKVS